LVVPLKLEVIADFLVAFSTGGRGKCLKVVSLCLSSRDSCSKLHPKLENPCKALARDRGGRRKQGKFQVDMCDVLA
jgi:hypothetical protein